MSGIPFGGCRHGCLEVLRFGELLDVDAADLRQLVLEGGEFGAACHVVGQLL